MPFYTKNNKVYSSNKLVNKTVGIDKNIIPNHINISTSNKLFNKTTSDRLVYSSQDPYGAFVRNPSCWLNGVSNISCFSPAQRSGYDWTKTAGTLITKKHLLFAKHFPPAIISGGTPIVFVDDNNNVVVRKFIQIAYDSTDIAIGLLDSEISSNIKIAKVLPTNYSSYIRCSTEANGNIIFSPYLYCVVLDAQEKAIPKILWGGSSYTSYTMTSAYNINNSTNYGSVYPNPTLFIDLNENIVVGDSGNPLFIIIDNELVLIHALLTTPANGPFITSRYDIVNDLIESLSPGEGYSLTPVDLQAVYNKYS